MKEPGWDRMFQRIMHVNCRQLSRIHRQKWNGIFFPEIKGAGRTNPNADANDHGYSWGAVAERFQRVDCGVTAVSAHGCESDARGLDCHLAQKEDTPRISERGFLTV